MAFIGNTPTQQAFTPAVDFFNGDGSTVAFTLSRPVASVAQVQAVVENVPQKPGDAFTVSGNTITFTSAPPSGTQNIYVYYTSPITQVIAPSQGTVNTTSLGTITNIASGSSSLTLQTGASNTTAMTIDTSQNVGIGTSSPSAKFVVAGGGAAIQGNGYPSAGSGWELYTDNSTGTGSNGSWLQSYSRTSSAWMQANYNALAHIFSTSGAERMRIDSSGNLLVGTTSNGNSAKFLVVGGANVGDLQAGFGGTNGTSARIYHADTGGSNAANTVFKLEKVGATGRSINAAGTINASGADYAEYMTKAGDFTVAKGDVVGINAEGNLTNVFADAVSFCVKSTDPSYVGGDAWGARFEEDPDGLELAQQKVDRIAFAGQVPVNVLGANAGQYIVPVNDNGAIKGEAVSNPTFEQYQIAVGKVIAIEQDGRARIIVKVA